MTFLMAQANLKPNFSCINTSIILKPSYYSSYTPAYEDGTDRVFRNVGIQNSDAGELPRKKKSTTFTTRRKFEIIKMMMCCDLMSTEGCSESPWVGGGHK
jgi:hypothetical protein